MNWRTRRVRTRINFAGRLLANHPRHRGVLDLAAQKAGWGTALPAGRARGIAMHASFSSFVCEVAEVSVGPSGKVRVHKVVSAVDCGRTVNPSIIEAQVESAIVYGLSAALYGAITLKDGRVEQSNFNDYGVLRMDSMPVVEVHIVPSTENPSGIGEPGTRSLAPAAVQCNFFQPQVKGSDACPLRQPCKHGIVVQRHNESHHVESKPDPG